MQLVTRVIQVVYKYSKAEKRGGLLIVWMYEDTIMEIRNNTSAIIDEDTVNCDDMYVLPHEMEMHHTATATLFSSEILEVSTGGYKHNYSQVQLNRKWMY